MTLSLVEDVPDSNASTDIIQAEDNPMAGYQAA